jgi:hypothetical protein
MYNALKYVYECDQTPFQNDLERLCSTTPCLKEHVNKVHQFLMRGLGDRWMDNRWKQL